MEATVKDLYRKLKIQETCKENNIVVVEFPFEIRCFYLKKEDGIYYAAGPYSLRSVEPRDLAQWLEQAGFEDTDLMISWLSACPVRSQKKEEDLLSLLQKITGRVPEYIECGSYFRQRLGRKSSNMMGWYTQQHTQQVAEDADRLLGEMDVAFQAGKQEKQK